MPYLQFDVAATLPVETKRRAARRAILLYAEIMQTAPTMVNVGFRELGPDNLWCLVDGELAPSLIVMCDVRRGRSVEQRGRLAEALRAMAVTEFAVQAERIVVEFTQHAADEMHRTSGWGREWSDSEAQEPEAGGVAVGSGDT